MSIFQKQCPIKSVNHWWDTNRDNLDALKDILQEYRQIVRHETITEIQQIMNDNYILSWADEIIKMKENK